MQRAAIYARYSTDLQSGRSVDDQIDLCADFAQRSGMTVVERYHDRALTGTTLHGRYGVAKMMRDAEAGRFNVIIVEALDRLSRDQADLAAIYKRLQFMGVEIVAVHDGRADAIQIGIRGLVSTLFIDDLKHKIRRGMTGLVDDGLSAGGKAYGYRPVLGQPGQLEIVEEEAEVIRRVFREYVDGASSVEIAKALNREGVPAPRTKEWTPSTILGNRARGYGILRNALYDGRLVWNRVRMIRHPETGRRVSRANPESEWKETPVEHLRIVPADLFAAAQRPDKDRETRRLGRKKPRILSGLLRCSHCGAGMQIHDTRNGVIRIKCSSAALRGTCENRRRYNLHRIEQAVVDGVRDTLSHPELLQALVEGYLEGRRELVKGRAAAEKRLARNKDAQSRLIDMAVDGRVTMEFFDEKMAPLREEEAEIKAELDGMEDPGPVTLHPAAVKAHTAALEDLARHMQEPDTADPEVIRLIRELIERVVVIDADDGGVEVEVYGMIGPLAGPAWGQAVVAEVRARTLPPLVFGRFAA